MRYCDMREVTYLKSFHTSNLSQCGLSWCSGSNSGPVSSWTTSAALALWAGTKSRPTAAPSATSPEFAAKVSAHVTRIACRKPQAQRECFLAASIRAVRLSTTYPVAVVAPLPPISWL